MSIKRITAIVPIQMSKPLGKDLRQCSVPSVTVERVQGYGEHANYSRRDLMQDNTRVVLYADDAEVDAIVSAIASCAHECGAMAGILAVESTERLVNLTDGTDVMSASL